MNIEIHGIDILIVFVGLGLFVRLIQSRASATRVTRYRTRKTLRSLWDIWQ